MRWILFSHWGRLIGYFQGRHDDPAEIAQDEVRQQIREGHRFLSFAGERSGVNVKWWIYLLCTVTTNLRPYERHVDAHDYMWAVSEMIDSAKEFIFILVITPYSANHLLAELDLTSGLVAYSRTVSPSTSRILPWMASRSSSSEKGRRRCKDSCHCVQRSSSSFILTGLNLNCL